MTTLYIYPKADLSIATSHRQQRQRQRRLIDRPPTSPETFLVVRRHPVRNSDRDQAAAADLLHRRQENQERTKPGLDDLHGRPRPDHPTEICRANENQPPRFGRSLRSTTTRPAPEIEAIKVG